MASIKLASCCGKIGNRIEGRTRREAGECPALCDVQSYRFSSQVAGLFCCSILDAGVEGHVDERKSISSERTRNAKPSRHQNNCWEAGFISVSLNLDSIYRPSSTCLCDWMDVILACLSGTDKTAAYLTT